MKCTAQWRSNLPAVKAARIRNATEMGKKSAGRVRLDTSIRMLLDNPVWKPGVVDKIRRKNLGRKLVSRGGNGKLTVSQVKLSEALHLPTEYTIPTQARKMGFKKVPDKYCVDIAHEKSRTAIEVDGKGHRLARVMALDLKKSKVLAALGWSVIRFTNQQVLEELDNVVREVRSHIRKKSFKRK